jgi:hypothetical protein
MIGFDFNREQLDDARGIVSRSLPDKDKKIRMSKLFSRAASNGDMNRVAEMLDNFRDWIDIEAQDEDGTTPLIYAACFGHTEIAFMLLEAGARVDSRDKFGWTALVWATNNKHENIVRLLLEQGASTASQTAKGHTIVDFLRHDPVDTTKIVQIFHEPGRRDSVSSNGSCTPFRTTLSSLGDDLFYQSGIDGFEEIMAENDRRYRVAMDNASLFEVDMADLSLAEQVSVYTLCMNTKLFFVLVVFLETRLSPFPTPTPMLCNIGGKKKKIVSVVFPSSYKFMWSPSMILSAMLF